MPTGYTAAVQDGITFKEFALRCARAFGAAVMQRDDPSDAPLTTDYEPSPYHKEQLAKSLKEKDNLDALTKEQWLNLLNTEHQSEVNRITEQQKKEIQIEAKYRAVLKDAQNWVPPSPEHQNIKDFMVQQLTKSIEWDCGTYTEKSVPKKPTLTEFKIKKYDAVNWSINYHTEHKAKEEKEVANRNKWLKDFVASLDGTQQHP